MRPLRLQVMQRKTHMLTSVKNLTRDQKVPAVEAQGDRCREASSNLDQIFPHWKVFSVRVTHSISHSNPATSGVPHGSTLGPLLFLVYVGFFLSPFQSSCLIYTDNLKPWDTIQFPANVGILQNDLRKLGW